MDWTCGLYASEFLPTVQISKTVTFTTNGVKKSKVVWPENIPLDIVLQQASSQPTLQPINSSSRVVQKPSNGKHTQQLYGSGPFPDFGYYRTKMSKKFSFEAKSQNNLQPMNSHHAKSQPVIPQKVKVQQAKSRNDKSQPAMSGKPKSQPAKSGKPKSQPAKSGKPKSQPAKSGKPKSQPAKSGKPKSQPAKSGKPKSQPAKSGKPKSQQAKTEKANLQQVKSLKAKMKQAKSQKAKPKSQKPKLQQPKSQKPKLQQRKSPKPKLQQPESQKPKLQQPESQKPELQQPESQMPKLQHPKSQKAKYQQTTSRETNLLKLAKSHDDKLPVIKVPKSESSELAIDESIDTSMQNLLLPVHSDRERIMEEIQTSNTTIIIGETGSGKTTQIPQFMYEAGMTAKGIIGITQPRRVAAITLALRVSNEMKCDLVGGPVGYSVRFQDFTSPQTKLKFVTDGMLFREAMLDSLLLAYSVIVLDEAHERTVQTDVLFGLVKDAQLIRRITNLPPLKIVVMSATMDVDHFSKYFDNAPIVYISGRIFPVRVFNTILHDDDDDYVHSCLATLFRIHRETPPNHDILVFLTGQEEIERFALTLKHVAQELNGEAPPLLVCPLYSSLPPHQQLNAFRPTPVGMRKVIVSTNIAETSVTITGIKYVIDSGKVKARTHQPSTGLDMLKVQQISQSQAWQRTGRAGRESPGFCYRVYTKNVFQSMPVNTVPEIQRCNLSSVVLQLLELNINVMEFNFIDKPPQEATLFALETLWLLGAIDSVENPHLTRLGHKMAFFPLDPKFSKIILSAKDYNCLDEILSIVALLSGESVFVSPLNKRDQALNARRKFESTAGDHITLLNIYRHYCRVKEKKLWCQENFINFCHLEYAIQVRAQLKEICQQLSIPHSSCEDDIQQIQKCLITGLFMNVAQIRKHRVYMTVVSNQVTTVHPSSVLFNSHASWVLYTDMIQTGNLYMRQLSVIDCDWIVDIVPAFAAKYQLDIKV